MKDIHLPGRALATVPAQALHGNTIKDASFRTAWKTVFPRLFEARRDAVQKALFTVPPSTRTAAPVVADASGLAR
jgi:hypothetical protein